MSSIDTGHQDQQAITQYEARAVDVLVARKLEVFHLALQRDDDTSEVREALEAAERTKRTAQDAFEAARGDLIAWAASAGRSADAETLIRDTERFLVAHSLEHIDALLSTRPQDSDAVAMLKDLRGAVMAEASSLGFLGDEAAPGSLTALADDLPEGAVSSLTAATVSSAPKSVARAADTPAL